MQLSDFAKKNRLLVFILTGLIILILSHGYLIFYQNEIKMVDKVFDKYNENKYQVVFRLQPQNYTTLITNPQLMELIKFRDDYNLNYFQQNGQPERMGKGYSYRKDYLLVNWAVLILESHDSILDLPRPYTDQQAKYKRIVLLKKENGKWYMEKDIFDYEKDVNLSDIFDPNYTKRQTEKYKKLISL